MFIRNLQTSHLPLRLLSKAFQLFALNIYFEFILMVRGFECLVGEENLVGFIAVSIAVHWVFAGLRWAVAAEALRIQTLMTIF